MGNSPAVQRLFFAYCGLCVAATVGDYLLSPIVLDTAHLEDTIFLADAGWRVFNGFTPGTDFMHFYGGVQAAFVSFAYSIFGLSVKSIDYAMFLQFLFAATGLVLISKHRIDTFPLIAILSVVAIVILTRRPIEGDPITGVLFTHSFTYNKFALALCILLTVFIARKAENQRFEIASAIFCGVTAIVLALVKPTFFLGALGLYLALCVQRRWAAIGWCLLGSVAAALLFDPDLSRFLNSMRYVTSSVGVTAESSVGPLLKKSIQTLLGTPLLITLVIGCYAWLSLRDPREHLIPSVALCLFFGSTVGMASTMGDFQSTGGQLVPILSVLAILAGQRAWKLPEVGKVLPPALCIMCTIAFTAPHLAHTFLGFAFQAKNRAAVAFSTGPLADYVSTDDWHTNKPRNGPPPYRLLKDGIEQLREIPDHQTFGIVSGALLQFSFATSSPPVLDFPIWPRTTSAEFKDGSVIPAAADIVMIERSLIGTHSVNEMLLSDIDDRFHLCRSSTFWDIYIKQELSENRCPDVIDNK